MSYIEFNKVIIFSPHDVLATLLNNLKVQERQNRVCTTVAIAIVAETCSPFTVLPGLMNEYRVRPLLTLLLNYYDHNEMLLNYYDQNEMRLQKSFFKRFYYQNSKNNNNLKNVLNFECQNSFSPIAIFFELDIFETSYLLIIF